MHEAHRAHEPVVGLVGQAAVGRSEQAVDDFVGDGAQLLPGQGAVRLEDARHRRIDGGVSAAIRRILPYPIRVAVDAAAALVSRIQEALSDPDEPHAQPSAAAGVADHGADIQEFVPVSQFVGDVMAHCGLAALMTGLVLSSLTQTTFVLECVAGLLYLGDEVPALCTRARSSDRSRVGTALELR